MSRYLLAIIFLLFQEKNVKTLTLSCYIEKNVNTNSFLLKNFENQEKIVHSIKMKSEETSHLVSFPLKKNLFDYIYKEKYVEKCEAILFDFQKNTTTHS